MEAWAPVNDWPLTVTVTFVPTEALANVPTAVPVRETVSPGTTPTNVPGVPSRVAEVVPSYVLFEAVIPVMVRDLVVMLATVVGWVSV